MKNNKLKILYLIMIGFLTINPINTFALTKQEVVFTNLTNTGDVKENIVNNHLKYISKEDIEDETILKNILNISGKEKFIQNDNLLTWSSKGKDITYQGNTDKDLPINVSIKYYLNDKEISKKKLLNKSGDIKIVINFENNSYDEVNGVHTPFVVTMASIIKGNNNSNIDINNGKVVNTGTKNIVVGIAAPGIYEDLGIDELKNMDTIIVNYNTTKFTNSDIYFVATPKILEENDLSIFTKLDNMSSSINSLQDGVKQLIDGSKQISDGTILIAEKLGDAVDGSKKITDGLSTINNSSSSISNFSVLLDTLYSKYNENSALLNSIQDGSAQAQLENGISEATEQLNDLMTKKSAYEQLKQLVDAGVTLPEEQLTIYNQLANNIDQINGGIEQYQKGIENAQTQLGNLPTSAAALTGSNQTIETILFSILNVDSMDNVPSAIENFKANINSLTTGLSQLQNGSNELTNGLSQLHDGANSLHDGANSLYNGLNKLNDEGISKLTNITSKINAYSGKVKNLIKSSKEYKGYSCNNADETIFIFKVNK